jgi:hypothetical protein
MQLLQICGEPTAKMQYEVNKKYTELTCTSDVSTVNGKPESQNLFPLPVTESTTRVGKKSRADFSEFPGFSDFWGAYPRKTAKEAARKAFARLRPTPELLAVMLHAIERQRAVGMFSDPQFIPHPATWINGRRWEDVPIPRRPAGMTEREARRAAFVAELTGKAPPTLKPGIERSYDDGKTIDATARRVG